MIDKQTIFELKDIGEDLKIKHEIFNRMYLATNIF